MSASISPTTSNQFTGQPVPVTEGALLLAVFVINETGKLKLEHTSYNNHVELTFTISCVTYTFSHLEEITALAKSQGVEVNIGPLEDYDWAPDELWMTRSYFHITKV